MSPCGEEFEARVRPSGFEPETSGLRVRGRRRGCRAHCRNGRRPGLVLAQRRMKLGVGFGLRRPIRDVQTFCLIRSCAPVQDLPSKAFTGVFPVPPIGLPVRIAKTHSDSPMRPSTHTGLRCLPQNGRTGIREPMPSLGGNLTKETLDGSRCCDPSEDRP
jgi:hypothetical protein